MKYEADILQSSVDTLKLELKKQKENEILLLKYPDLYGPMTHIDEHGESNVANDMQNQINANKHRIFLLNNLNKKLENSVRKLNETSNSASASPSKKETTITSDEPSEHGSNYFVKQPVSSPSVLSTPKSIEDIGSRTLMARPVPFFKLDSELEHPLPPQTTTIDQTRYVSILLRIKNILFQKHKNDFIVY